MTKVFARSDSDLVEWRRSLSPSTARIVAMRTFYQSSYERTHVDVFESRITEIKFGPFEEDFDEWTMHILGMFHSQQLSVAGIELEMGDLCIKESSTHPSPPSRIFRIREPEGLFWYVDIVPVTKQFTFIADKNHTWAIPAEEGIARIFNRQTNVKLDKRATD
jgi:hypothetical protein